MNKGMHWKWTPEQKAAFSAKIKGKPKSLEHRQKISESLRKKKLTPEQKAERARKNSESNKQRWANMTPEEREAIKAKMRHKHNLTPEGFEKLSENGKINVKNLLEIEKNNKKTQTKETLIMAISNNEELVNYIEQVKRKLRLFASTFDKQPIENLPRIDAFLAKMMPSETQEQFLLTPVTPMTVIPTEQPQKRKYTRHKEGSAGLSKYKAPYRQYKAAGGTLKWWDWLKFAKTGNFPSPMNPVPQSQQVK